MKSFRKLIVWEVSHKFVLEVYKSIDTLPKEEKYRLSDQLFRASYSIPMNVADGSLYYVDEFQTFLDE